MGFFVQRASQAAPKVAFDDSELTATPASTTIKNSSTCHFIKLCEDDLSWDMRPIGKDLPRHCGIS